jgi:uncharacterized membrane protein YdjX (TVP38/TMEM64 family)
LLSSQPGRLRLRAEPTRLAYISAGGRQRSGNIRMTAGPELIDETGAPEDASSASGWLRLALLAALIVVLAGAYATGLHRSLDWDALRAHVEDWREQTSRNLLVGIVVFSAAYIGLTTLSLPVSGALSLLCGALFGRWLGLGLVSISATTGAALAFLGSRYLFHDWVRQRFGHRLHAIDRGVRRDGAFYLLFLRLTPVPFFLVNLGMALTPIRLGTFVFVSWLGMLLPGFLYVNAGSELARIEHPADVLSAEVIVSLALLGLAPLAFRLVFARLRRV